MLTPEWLNRILPDDHRLNAPADRSVGDLPAEEFLRLAHETAEWMAEYLASVGERAVFPNTDPGDIRRRLPASAPELGEAMDDVLADFREVIVPGLNHWNHPAFFGYFSVSASGPGVLGEMLAAVLNVNAMTWRSSPAATELEDVVTDWLRQIMGLPEDFEGVINDTASSSTMYALAAARELRYPEAHQGGLFGCPPGRVYASDQAHSSVEKGVMALGFGRDGFRAIGSDSEFRMDVEALRAAMRADVDAGVRPIAVVATAGTTSTASLDPIHEIGQVAREFGAWLHVDAAYGGPAAIVPEFRPLLRGWEQADSIVVNPHKWLFTPIDCSVLYCRRPAELVRAFSIVPEYLTAPDEGVTRNLMDYGVSLGRRFRSLKLWFVLRYFGRQGLIDCLREHVRLATDFAGWVRAAPHWEVVAPVHLGTVVYRFVPELGNGESADAANHRILERVNASGDAFLTHTRVGGRIALRLAIGNVKTSRAHVEGAWSALRAAAEAEVHPASGA